MPTKEEHMTIRKLIAALEDLARRECVTMDAEVVVPGLGTVTGFVWDDNPAEDYVELHTDDIS